MAPHPFSVDEHLPAGGLDDAVEATKERGFTASRKAHDHEDLAFVHVKIHRSHGRRAPVQGQILNRCFGVPGQQRRCLAGKVPENLP